MGDRDLHLQFAAIERQKAAADLLAKRRTMRRKQRELESLLRKQKVLGRLLASNRQKEAVGQVVQLPFMVIQHALPDSLRLHNPAGDCLTLQMSVPEKKQIFDSDMDVLHEYYALRDQDEQEVAHA